jgi:hypothetical protein
MVYKTAPMSPIVSLPFRFLFIFCGKFYRSIGQNLRVKHITIILSCFSCDIACCSVVASGQESDLGISEHKGRNTLVFN